jgi:hypothetical protein
METEVAAKPKYEACGNRNIAHSANGGLSIWDVNPLSGNLNGHEAITLFGITDSGECCGECMGNPSCLGTMHSPDQGRCILLVSVDSGVCANGQYVWATYYSQGTDLDWVFSNGPCGAQRNSGTQAVPEPTSR